MTFTQEDKRDKIRSQLIYELTNPKPPVSHARKSPAGLSKKAKFLANPRKVKQPGEKPL
jgi:hypothetical protein